MIDCRLKLFEDNLLPPPRPAGRHFVLLEALLLLELVGVHTRSSRRGRGIGRLGSNRYESRRFGDGRKDGSNRRGVGDGRRGECLLGLALKTDDRRGEFAVAMECALEETCLWDVKMAQASASEITVQCIQWSESRSRVNAVECNT